MKLWKPAKWPIHSTIGSPNIWTTEWEQQDPSRWMGLARNQERMVNYTKAISTATRAQPNYAYPQSQTHALTG